jgi:hypothetical protein
VNFDELERDLRVERLMRRNLDAFDDDRKKLKTSCELRRKLLKSSAVLQHFKPSVDQCSNNHKPKNFPICLNPFPNQPRTNATSE